MSMSKAAVFEGAGELWFSKSIYPAVQTLEMIRSDGFDWNISWILVTDGKYDFGQERVAMTMMMVVVKMSLMVMLMLMIVM